MMSLEKGEYLVRLAREVVKDFAAGKKREYKFTEPWLLEKRGVFSTLHSYPDGELRGCVGFPLPVLPLGEALVQSAIGACTDERFEKISEKELDKIIVEVSVLSEPELIKAKNPEDLLEKIRPHKDGLILKHGCFSGLFLPQVWEQIPNKRDFLDNLCLKAGLPLGYWKLPESRIYRFSATIFKEETPRGNVIMVR